MPRDHSFSLLYDQDGVSVGDFRCRARASGPGPEEENPQHAIVFVRRGVCEKRVGRRSISATPNCVVFYPMGQVYRTRHPVSGGDECTVLTIDSETLRDLLASIDPAAADRSDPFPVEFIPVNPLLHLRHWRSLQALGQGQFDSLAMQQDLLDLCASALAEAVLWSGRTLPMQRRATRSAHRDLAHATASLLGSRFAAPLSLSDIAREVHSSPYHLSRIFRREMGLSIHRYLNRIRLRAAVDRLASGEPDLTILALDLGFSSRGHFYDAFRAEFDVAPSALRRELSRRI